MDGFKPVPIPGETIPEPEDKKHQNPIIRLAKFALLFTTCGLVIWSIVAILVTLWFPAERWDAADYKAEKHG